MLKHKFGAHRCQRGQIKFPSKLERSFWDYLEKLRENGKVRMTLRQIPFDLPAGKHFVDFMVFLPEEVLFLECKGKTLREGERKRQEVENIYDIDIHVAHTLKELYSLMGHHLFKDTQVKALDELVSQSQELNMGYE